MSDFDVVIVGSGAGGGTLARYLAEHGQKVAVIERGGWTQREPQNWQAGEVFANKRYISPDKWQDGHGHEFQPGVHYTVGGATKFYGAALYRMREADFGQVEHYGGISPAWPVSYDEMEAHYFLAEHAYQVHGGDGSSPFPAVRHEPVIASLADAMRRHGWNPVSAPCGVMLNEADTMPAARDSKCIKCNSCDGFACPLLAKADAETCGIRPALATGNVTLFTDTQATRILWDDAYRTVLGVSCTGPDGDDQITGDRYVLAAGAVNSAALFLRSGIPDWSQQAGRHLMMHQSQAVLAIGRNPIPPGFHKTLAVMDFYADGGTGVPFGMIQMTGQPQPAMLRGESALARIAPDMATREIASRSVSFWLQSEDLPRGGNCVTLGRGGQIRVRYRWNNERAADELYDRLVRALPSFGYPLHMCKTMGIDAVAHQCGTLRMAAHPYDGVCDPHGRVWAADNLYVGDASVFPSSSAVNPALTVMALAMRLGQHLIGGDGSRRN